MPDYSHITIPSRNDHEAFCDHVIAVERARKERKPLIHRLFKDSKHWAPRVDVDANQPLDWSYYDYAIAPEPPKKVLAPWKLGPELLGKKLKHRHGGAYLLIVGIYEGDSCPVKAGHNNHFSLPYLAANYVELLPDGTEGPCGTWEEQA